jgi:hypothetical protein
MDTHKNACLTPKGREGMVRAGVDCGLSKGRGGALQPRAPVHVAVRSPLYQALLN